MKWKGNILCARSHLSVFYYCGCGSFINNYNFNIKVIKER